MAANNDSTQVLDDGLWLPSVGPHTEDKHRLVSFYAAMFSKGMKAKWHHRIYVELYAGAGYSRIRDTQKIIWGSPLRALAAATAFDKYIFCEAEPRNMDALKVRVQRHFPSANVAYVEGDCDLKVHEILAKIPTASRDNTVLTLCFADPFDIGLRFRTIDALAAERFVDFLVLLALGMDANRNYEHYVKEDADKIDQFLGSKDWRERWASAQWDAVKFTRFLADEFTKSMAALRYIPPEYYKMKEVRSYEKNFALYRLALFSRNERAYEFWDEVLKYSTDQINMFEV
jgi:three-Cys-motif partner protein